MRKENGEEKKMKENNANDILLQKRLHWATFCQTLGKKAVVCSHMSGQNSALP